MEAILVVEDEALTAATLTVALEDAGYRVELAHSAADAYRKLRPEPRSFSAVVTDINLGPGDDGFEVVRQARKLNPCIQVAYVTANPVNLAMFEPDQGLMFPKPFDPAEVVEQLGLVIPPAADR